MNYAAFTSESLTMMYEAIGGVLVADDVPETEGHEPRFKVRDTAEWKKHAADLEAEMLKRGMMFRVIDWHEGQGTLPVERRRNRLLLISLDRDFGLTAVKSRARMTSIISPEQASRFDFRSILSPEAAGTFPRFSGLFARSALPRCGGFFSDPACACEIEAEIARHFRFVALVGHGAPISACREIGYLTCH